VTFVKTFTVAGAVALALAGCGSNDKSPSNSSSATASATPQFSNQQAPPARVYIDVTIAGGTVTPINQQVQAKPGQPIIVRVNSDAADQLHVHSNPEHTFDVKPEKDQQFQFAVDVPGKVDVELHHLDKTVATITVQ
jgi:major membrane immunogen (membrane-anchored lipoprotein)